MNNVHNINDYVRTPWGLAQQIYEVAPGITFYGTARHGGFVLSPEVNALVPQEIKENTFLGNGLRGWYEEDCDAAIIEGLFNVYRYRV